MFCQQQSQTSTVVANTRCTAVDEMVAAQSDVSTPVVHPWRVDPADISFENTAPDQVQIAVTVHNQSATWSPPTTMLVQAAVLGAFVPWRPLTSVAVPRIEPWGHVRVTTQALQQRATTLDRPEQLQADHVLAALDRLDARERVRKAERWATARLRERVAALRRPETTSDDPRLPVDILDLIGRPPVHWAGNFNVFIGGHAVERHYAQAVRIYPGRRNWAMFVVGSGTDAYAFHVTGVESGWQVGLRAGLPGMAWFRPDAGSEIVPNSWHSGRKVRIVQFSVCPPEGCGKGEVAVHVTKQSTGAQAIVEFSLDPRAAGPGCVVV
jgi:hypothetical protein